MITIGDIKRLPESEAKVIALLLWSKIQATERSLDRLSNQEERVLWYIGQGMTMGAIASAMGKSYHTILTYRSRIKQKMAFSSVPELQKFAFESLDELEQRKIAKETSNEAGLPTDDEVTP